MNFALLSYTAFMSEMKETEAKRPIMPDAGADNRPLVELTHVEKHYGDLHVLKDINLTVRKGEVLVIVGPSGSGKSTMCRTINRLETIDSGDIRIDGKPLPQEGKELAKLRAEVGMVFQSFNLFANKTILENVTLAPIKVRHMDKKEAEDLAMDLLGRVGVASQASKMPSQLSGGQQQRVAIARALATNPKVLLCDEATSALDPTTTLSILALLKELNEKLGVTVVVITHQMNVIEEICHRVAILDHGVIAEQGSVEDIFSHPQTDIGRRLVYPNGVQIDRLPASRVIRIAFNGGSSYEPLIASLAIDCGVKVNILGADTRNIEGKAFGTMLLGLPEDSVEAAKALRYIQSQPDITVEEVTGHA